MARTSRPPFEIADRHVLAGQQIQFQLPIARLVSGTPVGLPLIVTHGRTDGPTVWLSAAVHGDELNGVEIIRRVHNSLSPRTLVGTLIAAPIVNMYGFNAGTRELPDGRDLNRSFPGSARGSMAARMANVMMNEVVNRCSVGIDIHTGASYRTNLPQVRANLDDPFTLQMAKTFGAPIAIHARERRGSLRRAATEAGKTALLFEGGEANRFDRRAVEVGTAGVLRILGELGMIVRQAGSVESTLVSRKTRWTRAQRSGMIHLDVDLGDQVAKGDVIAQLYDPFGKRLSRIRARNSGLVIGFTQSALVNQGEAVAHIAELEPAMDRSIE